MPYQLNHILLGQLLVLSRMLKKDFLQAVRIGFSAWTSRTKNPEGYKMFEVIRICNALRIPSRLVFVPQEEALLVPTAEETFLPRATFKEIQFDMSLFRKSWTQKGSCGLHKEGKAQTMGVSKTAVNKWLKDDDDSSITVSSFFKYCELFGYDVYDFVKDPNMPVSYPKEDAPAKNGDTKLSLLQEELREQRALIAELKRKLSASRSANRALSEELEALRRVANYAVAEEEMSLVAEDGPRAFERNEDCI